jgi:hypothetical protein
MRKKLLQKALMLMLPLLLIRPSLAETCPSVKDIKTNHISGWKIYDSEEDVPLSKAREDYFKKNISQFSLAEWTNHHHKSGTIHCYYHDADGSDFEAYLVKDSFSSPHDGRHFWYQVTGSMHCAAGTKQCDFQGILPSTQLAKR